MSQQLMTLIAGVLLAAYLIGVLYALLTPPRQRDPQYGMAIGCLTMVALFIAGLGGLLAMGAVFDLRWLVRIIFFIAVFPGLSLTGSFFYNLVRRRRERLELERLETQT